MPAMSGRAIFSPWRNLYEIPFDHHTMSSLNKIVNILRSQKIRAVELVRKSGSNCHPKRHDLSDLGSHGGRRTIARCSCTPQGPMEAPGEKINVSSGPSKEIAGLKKMIKMKMTPGLQIRVCWNSRMKRSRYVGALWAYV